MIQRCFGCMREFDSAGGICPHCGYKVGTKAQESVHLAPGVLLHRRYTVGRVLGFGGFGVTYIGWDPKLEMRIAVKEFLPGEFSTRVPGNAQVTIFEGDKAEQFHDGMKKYVEEARHLAKFQNQTGIVKIYDSFEENGTAYIIMEYLEGETLADRLEREGTIPEDEAVRMLWPVMKSLNAVHQECLLHRDIAPDNIFLTKSGEVKLIDFGASRYATTSHSRSLTVIIKPGYSPEEQYRSRGDQGPYTDVYAMAATLYRMITGIVPPDALERRAKYENANKDILEEPHKIKKGISLGRENAILNAMNVRIEDRTPDMGTFMRELEADPPAKRIYGKIKKLDFYRLPLWMKIAIPAVLAIVLGMAVLMLMGVISFKRTQRSFYIPEGFVMVPDVEGLPREEANQKLSQEGLNPVLTDSIESKYITAGVIVLQAPGSGSLLERNGKVSLTISSGGEIAKGTVPLVIGKTEAEAREMLEQAGLEVTDVVQVFDDYTEEGKIVSQSLDSGTEVEEGVAISLEISKGPRPFKIENYEGMKEEEVIKALTDLGLKVESSNKEYSDTEPEGTVLGQSIKAGEEVRKGDSITLTVSSGKETFYVADVIGKEKEEAKSILKEQGFEVEEENIIPEHNDDFKEGLVFKQSPEGGNSQTKGTVITLWVSLGKHPIKLSFDSDGGSKVEAKTVYKGETYGELPIPTRSGYSFEGWYLTKDGKEAVMRDTEVIGSSDHTLVARWKEIAAAAPTTVPPTAPLPTTLVPTMPATTTTVLSTVPASTASMSTRPAPTTVPPTTPTPTTPTPTRPMPTTVPFTTSVPTAAAPTRPAPTTVPPTTSAPTIPYTRPVPTTVPSTTAVPITLSSISVKVSPSKKQYNIGEELDISGLILTARYSDGSTEDIDGGFECSPSILKAEGTQTIKVSYYGNQTSFSVKVVDPHKEEQILEAQKLVRDAQIRVAELSSELQLRQTLEEHARGALSVAEADLKNSKAAEKAAEVAYQNALAAGAESLVCSSLKDSWELSKSATLVQEERVKDCKLALENAASIAEEMKKEYDQALLDEQAANEALAKLLMGDP